MHTHTRVSVRKNKNLYKVDKMKLKKNNNTPIKRKGVDEF